MKKRPKQPPSSQSGAGRARPSLSKGELQVARVLWELCEALDGPATVRQVHEALPEDKSMEFPTVQTYLRRLEQKGYVTATIVGRARHYRARVKPTTVIRQTVDEFVDQLFDGEALPLVRHLVEQRGLSPVEIAQLRDLVDRMEDES